MKLWTDFCPTISCWLIGQVERLKESFTERKYTCTALTTEVRVPALIPSDFPFVVDGSRNSGFIFAVSLKPRRIQ